MDRRYAVFLRAFAVWTVYVWVTRLWNIWSDGDHDAAFKLVHSVLAVVSVGFAGGAWVIVSRMRRRAALSSPAPAGSPVRSAR